jgi:MoaA/NifB/PqqE/SkfB family radical SAM enzyme
LFDFLDPLRHLANTKILISLDAASAKHDMIRRKPGAFERIAKGLQEISKYPDLRDRIDRITIASILLPNNITDIKGIISFAADNGIAKLLLSPLLTSTRYEPLMLHPKVMNEAHRAIPGLLQHASILGVKLQFSDSRH